MAESSPSNVPVPIYFIDDESVGSYDKGTSVGGTYSDDSFGDGLQENAEHNETVYIETEGVTEIHQVTNTKWNCAGRDAAVILTCFPSLLLNIGCEIEVKTSNENFPEINISCSESEAGDVLKRWNVLKNIALTVMTKTITLKPENEKHLQNALTKDMHLSHLKFYWSKPEKVVYIFGHNEEELKTANNHILSITSESRQLQKSGRDFARSFSEDTVPIQRKTRSFPTSPSAFTFETQSGMNVQVYKADITELNVDAIVNAANRELQHGGGVARAISLKAGHQLDLDCQAYVRRNGYLDVGENMVSDGGNLRCNGVIHALGPRWSDYTDKSQCLRDLYKAVKGILKESKNQGYRTVAMPVISGGVYGVPKDRCAKVFVQAIHDHAAVSGLIPREFHIVDINDDIIKLMQDANDDHLRGHLDPYSIPNFMRDIDRNGEWQEVTKKKNDYQAHRRFSDYTSPDNSKSNAVAIANSVPSNRQSSLSRSNTSLKIKKTIHVSRTSKVVVAVGDIVSAEVECVICAIDKHLPGRIADALCRAGGHNFEKAYETIVRKEVRNNGEIFFLPGLTEKLKCDCVMFMSVDDSYYRVNIPQVLRSMFSSIQAKQLSIIAMPVFRAETLHEGGRKEFVKAVLNELKYSSIATTYLVCKDDDWKLKGLMDILDSIQNGNKLHRHAHAH